MTRADDIFDGQAVQIEDLCKVPQSLLVAQPVDIDPHDGPGLQERAKLGRAANLLFYEVVRA